MNAANDTKTLVPVLSIEITASENLGTGLWLSFAAVDDALRAHAAGGGCSKVWFRVTWADRHIHEGRVDITPEHQYRAAILGAHVRSYLEHATLRRIASGRTREETERGLRLLGITPERQADFEVVLDGYELGAVLTPVEVLAEEEAVARWRVAEKNRAAAESQAALEATWWTGAKYNPALSVGDVSRRLRTDLVAASKAPASLLTGSSFRVRSSGRAIYVYVTPAADAQVVNLERARLEAERPHGFNNEPRWTELGTATLAAATAIGNAFNYDKSDRGRGHDYTREAFALFVDFAPGVEGAVWDAARAEAAARKCSQD